MAGSGPTLDVCMLEYEEDDIDGESQSVQSWGRLFPLGKGLKGIGMAFLEPCIYHRHIIYVYTSSGQHCLLLTCLDLIKDEYTFGRADECDYCFEMNGGRDNAHFRTFSNTHFRLYKVCQSPPPPTL